MTARALLVQREGQLVSLCEELLAEGLYGFDTEFHREKTYRPHLALIQLAWRDRVAIVDPLAVDPAPLARVLGGPAVAVAHAADQDLSALGLACGVVPGRLFDTQVAAGFLGLSSPSLVRLVEDLLGTTLAKGDRLTDWMRRPLTSGQLAYAAGDVAHLLELYRTMTERLEAKGRLEWAWEECDEVLRSRRDVTSPEEAWWKISGLRSTRGRGRGVAQEVAAWRERRAAETDVPRRVVLGDLAVSAIVHGVPRDRKSLMGLRGLEGRKLSAKMAAEILAAVERGRELSPEQIREPPERRESEETQALVAVAAGLVAQTAADQKIDSGMLATRADLFDLVAGRPSRLDHGWRRELIGDPVRKLATGELAVAFDGRGRLVVEERSGRRPSDGSDG